MGIQAENALRAGEDKLVRPAVSFTLTQQIFIFSRRLGFDVRSRRLLTVEPRANT
jgi:hypothetical protein